MWARAPLTRQQRPDYATSAPVMMPNRRNTPPSSYRPAGGAVGALERGGIRCGDLKASARALSFALSDSKEPLRAPSRK